MVDVFDDIKDLLSFSSDDDFYYLQILQRKKENPELGSNSRVIKNYYIRSLEHLSERYEEIKGLCNFFNARASLRLNKRSFEKVAFKSLQNYANTMSNKDFNRMMNSYDRACGQSSNQKNDKRWIVDIDGEYSSEYLNNISEFINKCMPEGDKVLKVIPTKNGIHLITNPFNLMEFKNVYGDIDVHKDNPINLYIP